MKKKTTKEQVHAILSRLQKRECSEEVELTALQRRAQFRLVKGGRDSNAELQNLLKQTYGDK